MNLSKGPYQILSYTSSTITGRTVLVQDAATMSLSLVSVAASVVTVQGSNAHGLTSAIPEHTWSTVTVLTGNGIYAVQPGMRWLRALQAASGSSNSLALVYSVR